MSAKQYGVLGNPVEHSLSPSIHKKFAAQFNQDIEYKKIFVPHNTFIESMTQLIDEGLCGANVTVPFKGDAFNYCHSCSEYAQRAGAVNTLIVDHNRQCFGANTDGVGLVKDLTVNQAIGLCQKKILLLGAGGATQGILEALLRESPAYIFLVNRTLEKAQALAQRFSDLGRIQVDQTADASGETFDIIINATSVEFSADATLQLSQNIVHADTVAYDLSYNQYRDTKFLLWAKACGLTRCIDGLGMLVEQAAESFYLWHDKRPATSSVLNDLRSGSVQTQPL